MDCEERNQEGGVKPSNCPKKGQGNQWIGLKSEKWVIYLWMPPKLYRSTVMKPFSIGYLMVE